MNKTKTAGRPVYWKKDTLDALVRSERRKQGATRFFNIEYTRAIQEEGFLSTLNNDVARLKSVASYLNETAQMANRVYQQNSKYGILLNAALKINEWLAHFENVRTRAISNRATLAARVVKDLGEHLGWQVTKQHTSKVLSSGAILKKEGRQIVVRIKFPTIYKFNAEIQVPDSKIKHIKTYDSADESSFLTDAEDFIRQLIRLR